MQTSRDWEELFQVTKTANAARSGHLGQAAGTEVKVAAPRSRQNVFPGKLQGLRLMPTA